MFSERVYRRLLVVYPKEHREEYGELMVQLFRDRMRRDGDGFRVPIVWMQMIFDLAGAAFKEHKEGVEMRKLTSIGIGLAVVLAAVGIGTSVLLAKSDYGLGFSVVWLPADGSTMEEPEVSVVRNEEEPEFSVVWLPADGSTMEEPEVSVDWNEAGGSTVAVGIGTSVLLANSDDGSVVWLPADGSTMEEPEVSVVRNEEEPEFSVVWLPADGSTMEEPEVSVDWNEAGGGTVTVTE